MSKTISVRVSDDTYVEGANISEGYYPSPSTNEHRT
jgi:hypothetical protein